MSWIAAALFLAALSAEPPRATQPRADEPAPRVTLQIGPDERTRIPFASWSARLRLLVSGTGELLSCTASSEGPVPPRDRLDCPTFAQARPEALLHMRGGAGEEPIFLIVEVSMVADGVAPAPPGPPLSADARLILRAVSSFELAGDGRIENCRLVEAHGLPDRADRLCSPFLGPYLPPRDGQGRARRATALLSVSVSTDRVPPD